MTGGAGRFSSAVKDMASGDHNEWEMGLQFNMPIGFRQAHSGVRNQELKLMRERVVLQEQEKQIVHDLGTAMRQCEQKFASMQYAFNRMLAAKDMRDAREAGFAADAIPLDLLLDAQQSLADAQREFCRAQVDFQLANESIQFASGQLLVSHAVQLTTGDANLRVELPQRRIPRKSIRQMLDYRFL